MSIRILVTLSFLIGFLTIVSAVQATISYTSDVLLLGQVNQPLTFSVDYTNPSGWQNLKEMSFWIDTHTPRGYRLHYSLHGKLKNVNGAFKLYGERYQPPSPPITCGSDAEVRHCYQNYAWDVGGLDPGSYLYMNHDEGVSDTTNPGENSIGQVRVVSLTGKNASTVTVVWEVVPYAYFADKPLDLYINGLNEHNGTIFTDTTPVWRNLKKVRIYGTGDSNYDLGLLPNQQYHNGCNTETDKNTFAVSGANADLGIDTAVKYLGTASCKLTNASKAEYDFQTNRNGVLTVNFYDDNQTGNAFYMSVSNAPETAWNLPTTHTLVVGFDPQINAQNYVYKARLERIDTGDNVSTAEPARYFDTGIARTPGWHQIVFWVTPEGAWAELDDPAKAITHVNLSSLPYAAVADQNLMRSPYDWEMSSFRYVRVGTWTDTGNVRFDNLSLTDLPSLPLVDPAQLETYAGTQKWQDYFAGVWLDTYEELAMHDNLTRLTPLLRDGGQTWWWQSITHLITALSIRYKTTGLPYYRDATRSVFQHMVDHATEWNTATWNQMLSSGSNLSLFTTYVWPLLTDTQRLSVKTQYLIHLGHVESATFGGDGYIGDSHAEDYAWGPIMGPLTAAIYFQTEPGAARWADLAIKMARKAYSPDRTEACPQCGGQTGVQTVYRPGQTLTDCPANNSPSGDCLCPGDRALLPANRDFAFLMDNHDFNPHPGYMSGVIDGITGAAATVSMIRNRLHFPIPAFIPGDYTGFNPHLLTAWNKINTFFDLRKNRYVAENIFRVRTKAVNSTCSGTPYDQTSNAFRTHNLDDWGNSAIGITGNVNLFLKAKEVLGDQAPTITDGKGQRYTFDDIIAKRSKLGFYMFMDYIKNPQPPNVSFTAWDMQNYDNSASNVYIMNRLNGVMGKLFRVGLIDPAVVPPLLPAPTTFPEDRDANGRIDFRDFLAIISGYSQQISIFDFSTIFRNFGR